MMSVFPKVQSPCPYKGKFADIMQGSQCRLCKREVVDLTEMTTQQRQDFLSACDTEVCISYRVGAKSALAAMAMSAVAVPTAAAAQGSDAEPAEQTPAEQTQAQSEGEERAEVMWIIVGGMRKPGEAQWVKDTQAKTEEASQIHSQAAQKPALAVEYDDDFELASDTPEPPDEPVPAH